MGWDVVRGVGGCDPRRRGLEVVTQVVG